jgi:hypothetical protein
MEVVELRPSYHSQRKSGLPLGWLEAKIKELA